MIYLASPYTDFDREIMHERYLAVLRATAMLLNEGKFIFSPIVHCHEPSRAFALRHDFEFWRDYNFHMLELAEALYILDRPHHSWQQSKGVNAELEHALKLEKPVWRVKTSASVQSIEIVPFKV